MTADRTAPIREAFKRWNAGVREFAPDLLADDIVIHSVMAARDFHGREGFSRWTEEFDRQFKRWRLEIARTDEAEDGRIAVLGFVSMVGRSSGVKMDNEAAWLIKLRDGRIAEMWSFFDHAAALQAGGFSS